VINCNLRFLRSNGSCYWLTCIGVGIKERELGSQQVDSNSMPLFEGVADIGKWHLHGISLAWFEKFLFVETFTIPEPESTTHP